jgi:hypothetical protein
MKKLFLLALAAGFLGAGNLSAAVVRPAPNISWLDYTGKLKSLSAFKGQPVVILVAPSPQDRAFRAQVGQLQKMYERYAAAKVVFVAAFTGEPGRIKSNIPFAVAADGPRVAFDYQTGEKFGIAIVGRDGNLDYVTDRVVPAQRILDVIRNSFVPQQLLRRP